MAVPARTQTASLDKPPPPRVTGAAFWALMDRWGIPDAQALAVIDHAPSRSAMRPRFALTTEQAQRLALLREIDRHAADLDQADAGGWLKRPNRGTMFAGRSPIEYMARAGREGIEDVLRYLHLMALGGSLTALRPRARKW